VSRENVEMVRRILAALDQGDDPHDLLAREFVMDFSRRRLNPVVVRGRDEVRAFAEGDGQMWEGGHLAYQSKELIDAGDKVLAFVRVTGRGQASGVEVEADTWVVWTFRDGKPVEWTYFGDDRASALKAVGLEA
jgi:ketosteroid isomerase-like protein